MSTASSTPAGGWYADPLDGSLLRWWTGSTWSEQTMSAESALADAAPVFSAAPPVLSAVPTLDEPYVPPNSVFRMPEAGTGEAYSPEWSAIADIAQDIALNGVPVQLALTSGSTEPPIPVSIDAFPMLTPQQLDTPAVHEPDWQVEAPLAKPVEQLFPVDGPVALSAKVFPATSSNPAPVPPPAGRLFPGLVPNPGPTLTAPSSSMPPAAAPAPVAQAVVAAVPELYTGPPPVQMASAPVADSELQTFATRIPGTSYVPLTPRPIPQPAMLGTPAPSTPAPVDAFPGPAAPVFSEAAAPLPPAPTEYWPAQGAPPPGAVQPGPVSYVPFDPNAVHLKPVPMIPFSSRDPYNSASTARPGMRAYAGAPVGPSGSTWTGGVVFMLLAPLLQAGAYVAWTQLAGMSMLSTGSVTLLPIALIVIGLFGIAAAQFDRNGLAKRGYFDLAPPFWALLGPLIYLIVRATRLRGQGRGAPGAIVLLLSSAASVALFAFAAITFLSTPTPDRVSQIETSIQSQLAAKAITSTISCPSVPSLAQGSTFACTMKTSSATIPIQVTITNWYGDFSVASGGSGVSGMGAGGAA